MKLTYGSSQTHLYKQVFKQAHRIVAAAAAPAKSLQSYLTLCDPIDISPPGSAIPGILQARTLEWVAISFSSAWKWKVKVKSLSHVWLFATPWTAAYQAPPSMGFSRQEYWSGVPLPSLTQDSYETEIPKSKHQILQWAIGFFKEKGRGKLTVPFGEINIYLYLKEKILENIIDTQTHISISIKCNKCFDFYS